MATYKCLADLQGKVLKYRDIVILKNIKYIVNTKFLSEEYDYNERIFEDLSIPNKERFATTAYGYESDGGAWPECRPRDYEALTRCVIELYKIIEGKTSTTFKKEKWYKISTPGMTGISPEQVKKLIIKYGGLLDTTFTYKSMLGVYVWTENTIVDCIDKCDVREDAIEVSPTTEIIITKKEEKYENQFQRKKARIERGTRPEGSTVCGRRGKASVAIGHLSYRKVTGI